MQAYIWNTSNIFCGTIEVQPSPLEPGEYLLPSNATLSVPPQEIGKQAKWNGTAWELVDPPAPDMEKIRQSMLAGVDKRTASHLNKHGVTFSFDYGNGEEEHTFSATTTAKTNWLVLQSDSRDCIEGTQQESDHFPYLAPLFPSERTVTISTAVIGFAFATRVLREMELIRLTGTELKRQIAEAVTLEVLSAIVDNRFPEDPEDIL